MANDKDFIVKNGLIVGGNLTVNGTAPTSFSANTAYGDGVRALFGDGSDLQIYHDGTRSYISEAGPGNLWIRGQDISIKSAADEDMAYFANDGAVTLYYDNAAKVATTSTGIDITGTVTSDGLTVESTTATILNTTGTDGSDIGTLYFSNTQGGSSGNHAAIRGIRTTAAAGAMELYTKDAGGIIKRMSIDNLGDISFYEDTGTTAKFFWDASTERLGIGTTSPVVTLDVRGRVRVIEDTSIVDLGSSATYAYLYNRSNSAFLFGTNDTERMRIDSSGRVAIGETSISGYNSYGDGLIVKKSTIAGSSGITVQAPSNTGYSSLYFGDPDDTKVGWVEYSHTADSLTFASGNAIAMLIDSSGNLLVGTTTLNSGTLGSTNTFAELAGSANGSGTLILSRQSNTNNDEVGGIRFVNSNNFDDDGLDADGKLIAGISARTDTSDSNANDDAGAHLVFYTKPEAGNYAERMRIDSSGDVGIGTASPSYTMDVYGPVASRGSGVGNAAFVLQEVGNNPWHLLQFTGGAFSINYNGTSSAASTLLIDASGNVGIGTTSPSLPLHVFAGTNNSQVARFTGAQLNRGLTVSTYSSGGINDGGVDLAADVSFRVTTASTERIRINSSGYVGIVTTSPGYLLDVGDSASSPTSGYVFRVNSSGDTIFSLSKAGTSVMSIRNDAFGYAAITSNGGSGLMLGHSASGAGAISNHLYFSSTETIFNDSGADRDFRVETSGNGNMLFIDGGSNHVNIGTSADLGATFNINGDALTNNYHRNYIDKTINWRSANDGTYTGYLLLVEAHPGSGTVTKSLVEGRIRATRGGTSSGNANGYVEFFAATGYSNDTAGMRTYGNSAASQYFIAMKYVTVTATGKTYIAIQTTNTGGQPDNGVLFTGSVGGRAITDSDTLTMKYNTEVSNVTDCVKTPYNHTNTVGTVINEQGGNFDFRVEGDNNTHLLFVDGSADKVGIGLSSPAKLLHINGETQIDNGPLNLGGTASINGNNPQLRRTNSSNDLGISAGGVDRITVIGNTGYVGIGTTTPVAGLHINTNVKSLSLASPASGGGGASYIIMGNNDSGGTAGPNVIVSANRALLFGLGDSFSSSSGGTLTEKIRIDVDGLKFNGDTATANALDDYEEGTWTPTVTNRNSAPTGVTYSYRTGIYTKIGNTVYFECSVKLSAYTAGSGEVLITGLPYSAYNIGAYRHPVFSTNIVLKDSSVASNVYTALGDTGSKMFFRRLDTNADTSLNPSDINGITAFIISGTYITS